MVALITFSAKACCPLKPNSRIETRQMMKTIFFNMFPFIIALLSILVMVEKDPLTAGSTCWMSP
jgi:hypothetical protein